MKRTCLFYFILFHATKGNYKNIIKRYAYYNVNPTTEVHLPMTLIKTFTSICYRIEGKVSVQGDPTLPHPSLSIGVLRQLRNNGIDIH